MQDFGTVAGLMAKLLDTCMCVDVCVRVSTCFMGEDVGLA